MHKTVYYFVDDISTPFVMKDIQKIAAHFEEIVLFSCEPLPEKEQLPSNVKLIESYVNWRGFSGIKVLLGNLFPILGIYFREILAMRKYLPLKRALALLSSNAYKAKEVVRQLKNEGRDPSTPAIFYSFWFYDCIYLAFIKKQFRTLSVFARAHSGDLYEDHISIRDNLLFRHFQLRHFNGLFPVSHMGETYLRKRYPAHTAKINTVYLGTEDPGVLNPFDPDHFVIVSCASIRHHKRIHKIAEALLFLNMPLTWYHFGDENLHTSDPCIPEYLRLKKALEQKSNIRYIPMGQTSNDEIFNLYKSQPINLFISISEIEGIPVSIMEAISFGIPVLCTNVGGCKEIVTEETGILIPLETEINEVSQFITEYKNSSKNSISFRNGVRKFWEEHFDIKKNYLELKKHLNYLENV